MSVRVMAWVWDQSESEGNDRLVLLAIADCASDDGGNAYPSVATLVRKTKTSERTVQRAIKSVVQLGELTVFPQSGPKGCNRYRVNMTPRQIDTPVKLTPPQSDTPVNLASDPRQSDTPAPVKLTPEPSVEPSTETSVGQEHSSSDAPHRPDVEKVCEHLVDRIVDNGSKRPTITDGWRTSARLLIDRDGRTVDQVLKAIDWCQDDEFWRSNILSMPKLRQQYDQLRLAATRAAARSPTARRTARPDWAAMRAEALADIEQQGEAS